jgi:protein tyrosine phosphatase
MSVLSKLMGQVTSPLNVIPIRGIPGRLYVGSVEATRPEILDRYGITTVISLYETGYRIPAYVQRYSYRIKDDKSQRGRMEKIMPGILNTLHHHLMRGENVLVHCHMGMQRAPTVAVKYLMAVKNMPQDKAIDYVKSKRPVAFLNGYTFF